MGRTSMTEHSRRLRGTEFRSSLFWRSADQLFTKLENMPPAAPDRSAPAGPPRSGILMSQNQLVAADKPVSSSLD